MLISIVMLATMIGLQGTSPRSSATADWVLAMSCFFISSLLNVVPLPTYFPAVLSPGIANTLYLLGHCFIFSGIRRHITQKHGYKLTVIVAAITLLFHFVPAIAQSLTLRIIVFHFLILFVLTGSIFYILRYRRCHPQHGFSPLLLVLGLFCAQLLVQIFVFTLNIVGLKIALTLQLHQVAALFVMLYILASSMSFAYLITWEKEQALHTASFTDSLTQWQNRRALMHQAPKLFANALTQCNRLSILVVDVDHFKMVNDTYGHGIGDKVLQHITTQIRMAAPSASFYCRLGGEEFALLLENTTQQSALKIAEDIRARIVAFPFNESVCISLSVSIGVATAYNHDASWETILDRADKALYKAKTRGRNKVC